MRFGRFGAGWSSGAIAMPFWNNNSPKADSFWASEDSGAPAILLPLASPPQEKQTKKQQEQNKNKKKEKNYRHTKPETAYPACPYIFVKHSSIS